ncbi:hypothetical protein PUNSTDRAFT_56208 [Punctularia strigosozonata HHB-11173 SS5]|uniref:Zn(2)-C6 fungal-type domain-containing protein n=1 Tax=Punctularia strigosozonata (strain HHB-11173) TaxID=741275 RepID=R7S0U5_PUNST|nr:uncharacterized protein PUNSTDRAFT_56208 [Punctularia strigosozonata HHB-11173 SS5]EIN03474.1 hypothetical protein PUNSTDRAFT_56208 [Punctularia strigosozonata HHB-11173 SS5]
MRKAKCSGESPCKRCVVRGLVCEYIGERKVRGSVKNRSRRGSVRDRSASDASTVSTASTSATSDDPVPSSPDMSAFSDLAQDMSSLSAFEKPRSMSLHIGMESTIYHRRRSTASDASDSGSCSSSEGISGGFLSLPDANASTLLSRRRAQSLSSPILTPRPMHAAARSAGTMPPSPLGQWTPMTLAYPESQDFRFGNPPLLHGNYLEEVTPRVDQAQQAWIETSAVNPFPEY